MLGRYDGSLLSIFLISWCRSLLYWLLTRGTGAVRTARDRPSMSLAMNGGRSWHSSNRMQPSAHTSDLAL